MMKLVIVLIYLVSCLTSTLGIWWHTNHTTSFPYAGSLDAFVRNEGNDAVEDLQVYSNKDCPGISDGQVWF